MHAETQGRRDRRRSAIRSKRLRRVALTLVAAVIAVGGISFLAQPSVADGTYSLMKSSDASKAVLDSDRRDVELGMRFSVTRAGTLDAIRFLKAPGDVSSRYVTLWSGEGRRLALARSTAETASGWQQVKLARPVSLKAGAEYVVSYHARRYMSTENYFTDTITAGPITAPGGKNGVYNYGRSFPRSSWRSSSYWIDVEVTVGGTAPPVAPSTSATTAPATTDTTLPPATSTTAPTTAAPSTTTATGAPSSGGGSSTSVLALPRVPWDGGAGFYSSFAKAKSSGWSDPSFFPISVYLAKPAHAEQLKALGVNTYMGAEHDGSKISTITSKGMYVLAQDEWSASELGNDPGVVGHLVSDECDMGLGCSGGNAAANLIDQKKMVSNLAARNDGRFTQANYGNGVLGTFWADGTFDDLVQAVDVTSVDKYAYTSPHVQGIIPDSPSWVKGASVASSGTYGWLQDRMVSYMNKSALHPNWVMVETARPYLTESGSKVIKPDQIEGAVWSSLIHEARGITYFQHSNDPSCSTYSLIECDQARKDKVKQISAQVKSLAPVLNSQSYVWNFAAGVDTMLKAYGGNAYIFSGVGLNQTTGSKSFTLPAGVSGGSVTVVDENRTIPVTNGKFTDSFASEYTHHIYKVALS